MKRGLPWRSLAIIALLGAAWIGIGTLVSNSYYQLMLAIVPIWAVMGLSWNVLSGYTGLVSFGHASFFGLGAYTVTLALVKFDLTPWFGIPIGMAVGVIAALVIGYPTFRLRGHYFALAMLAYPLALLYVFEWLGYQEVALPMKRETPGWYMQFEGYRVYIALGVGLLLAALLASLAIERSRMGLSLLAIKQNEAAAEAAGIDSLRWKMRAIAVSGALAAAAGGLYAVVLLVITPAGVFGMLTSAQALIVALFGGAGTLWGPVIGAVILIPLGEILHAEFGDIVPGIQGVVFGIAIVAVILLAPEGIYWRLHDRFAKRREAAPPPAASAAALTPLVPTRTDGPLLAVERLSKTFGGVRAVQDVSFSVEKGELLGIIGPNGAGKTTLFNLLNGFQRPTAGRVVLDRQELAGLKPNRVCRLGVGRTFQVVRAFPRMTVLQNVVVGAYVATSSQEEAWALAGAAVARVGLSRDAGAIAAGLSNKQLRLMELARALAGRPRLLLLDETLAGLGRGEVEEMIELIRTLPADGTTVMIIEHTMHAMVRLADRFLVLDHGRVLADGPPAAVTRDASVVEAYLGKKWAMASAGN